MKKTLLILLACLMYSQIQAQLDLTYKEPAESIRKLAEAPPAPSVLIDESGKTVLLLHRTLFSTIEELADDEYRLAGLRINPRTNGRSRARYFKNITLKNVDDKEESVISGMPQNPLLGNVSWSPDFSKVAFTNDTETGIELWVLDIKSKSAKRITEPIINGVLRNPYAWMKNSDGLICRIVPNNRGALSSVRAVPTGPTVQENLGSEAPARTYQDLLKSKEDEHNFDYFLKSRLIKVGLDGKVSPYLNDDFYLSFRISPDGKFVLIETLRKPYSYLVPYSRFPFTTSVYDMGGNLVKKIHDTPLDEVRPKGFMATTLQPRSHNWRSDKGSTLYWVQALDDGDPKKDVKYRDALYEMQAPFTGAVREIARTKDRFSGVDWGNENLAVIYDRWRTNRTSNIYLIDPSKSDLTPSPTISYNTEELYSLPGNFAMKSTKSGSSVLLTSKNGKSLYLIGSGQSPEGLRPFIDEYDIKSGNKKRLWRADGKTSYERIVDVLDISTGEVITSRESTKENPNYYVRNIRKSGDLKQITFFPNPYSSMDGVVQMDIQYKRGDGVDLNAVLYLPPNYNKERDGKLPVFLWAYPREFKSAEAAGQVKDTPHRFVRMSYGSPIFWAVRGYAVLDRTDFPIIGEGDKQPNDTFVEQLMANAQAAIDELDKMGVGDRNRIGVGGHSYGAFMTANLLAHTNLFAAGIARSGAYNRTLTPFGFQGEERTFWEAPEIYFKMSPFMHAQKIDEPLLLVHGTHDNNSGTFPMQSDRLYNAVKGHGGTVRLVKLPYESHGYTARESVMHMLWEMDNWLETYVKNREMLPAETIDLEKK